MNLVKNIVHRMMDSYTGKIAAMQQAAYWAHGKRNHPPGPEFVS